jgi:hypothetical protein
MSVNNKHQNYAQQQFRGQQRKTLLVETQGGACLLCGYKRNPNALSFHHKDPSAKQFQLDLRNCSNRSWKSLLAEASKCLLVCLNCHAEIHSQNPPDLSPLL